MMAARWSIESSPDSRATACLSSCIFQASHEAVDRFCHRPPIGLVVKVSTSRATDPGLIPVCAAGIFPGRHTSDLNIGTPVAHLPGAWHYRVSAGSGWPSVNIL